MSRMTRGFLDHAFREGSSAPRWALVCYLTLALLGLAARSDRVNLSGDGAQYASEAENLGRGRGFATSLPYYDEHHRLGPLPVSQTVFPPGYPAIVAGVLALGIPVDRACLLVAMIGQVAGVIALYLAANGAGHPRMACLLASATWACFVVNCLNVLHCASESTYIPLTLAAAAACCVSGRPGAVDGPSWRGPWPAPLSRSAISAFSSSPHSSPERRSLSRRCVIGEPAWTLQPWPSARRSRSC